jgi:hypothetical protein
MKARRWRWYFRCLTEINTWPRAWFVTLTFRSIPENPYREVQLWLKRLRKTYKESIRYIVAQEHGTKNGRIHYHLLLFGQQSLKRRTIEDPWKSGFSNAKLATPDSAAYVTKYLMKSNARVRASAHFGKGYENVPF